MNQLINFFGFNESTKSTNLHCLINGNLENLKMPIQYLEVLLLFIYPCIIWILMLMVFYC